MIFLSTWQNISAKTLINNCVLLKPIQKQQFLVKNFVRFFFIEITSFYAIFIKEKGTVVRGENCLKLTIL
jgi:hypothetical protein